MNSNCIILFSVFAFLFLSCNNNQQSSKQQFTIYPEDTIMITFDIDTFTENNTDTISNYPSYEYTTEDGVYIKQIKVREDGYQEVHYFSDSLYYDRFHFCPNGNLRCKGRSFKYGEFPVGRTIYYDESGNITEIEGNDAHYKFTLDEVLKFIEHENIDIRKGRVSISRNKVNNPNSIGNEVLKKQTTGTYFWSINISFPNEGSGGRQIVLNAIDGSLIDDVTVGSIE